MANRLAATSSPYLLQHAGNPVDWWPWCDAAFDEAVRRDVPVFLSIGYATCHWCHVMERESFEDVEVADLLNREFVCVKVDREERPDVDHQYMAVCQAIGRQCGWPLTVWITPQRLPFYVATYLPKSARFGRPGLLEVAGRVRELWTLEREKVETSAFHVAELVRRNEHLPPPEAPRSEVMDEAWVQLEARYDAVHGGFGSAPKFPMTHNLVFLLRYGESRGREQATNTALATLRSMARAGIHDQLGGGFHRYSTDDEWRLPHFEKMLYDQAWALVAYTEGWDVARDELLRETALGIASYLVRDLRDPQGGFYSGEDADSQGEEGLFYLWTLDEVETVLDADDAALARAWYGLERGGNYLDEATRRPSGRNVLHPGPMAETRLESEGMDRRRDPATMDRIRETLLERRSMRVRPSRDEKILADWNGLAIGALARAGARFGEPTLVDDAGRAAGFVIDHLKTSDGELSHVHFRGQTSVPAFLDDYAFLAWGCLELGLASHDTRWIEQSVELCERLISIFRSGTGGFWHTSAAEGHVLVRQQLFHDGAMPSGNAVALDTLARLARLTGRFDLDDIASQLAAAAGRPLNSSPGSCAGLLIGLMQTMDDAVEVILVGSPGTPEFEALASAVSSAYLPGALVRHVDPNRPIESALRTPEWAETPLPAGWRAAAYVCRNKTCEPPVATAGALLGALGLGLPRSGR